MVKSYSLLNKTGRVVWGIIYVLFFRFSPRPFHEWRAFLLRRFGAQIGPRCHIYSTAKIWAPWNLECQIGACIADGAEIYNPARVMLDEGAIVSQGAYLCAASRNYEDPDFPVIESSIRVGKRAWVAARSIVLLGVTIGDGCVVGAGSVVTRSMPPYTLCVGNPAKVIKQIRNERPC
jgi:putative colanic acid biosynthesis acetyltransferase WcaF